VDLPTLEGKTSLKIPSASQSGETLILKGKGMPRVYGSGKGDQIVILKVETPKRLTKKQRELMEELKGEGL